MSFPTCYGTGVPSYSSVNLFEPQQPLDPPEYPEELYFCPVCDRELDYSEEVYTTDGEVIGCEYCVDRKDAGEVLGNHDD